VASRYPWKSRRLFRRPAFWIPLGLGMVTKLRAWHVLSTTSATLASGALALGLTILVARVLPPEQNGYYAQFVVVFNLVYTALNFGMGPASTFFVASQRASARTVLRINVIGLTALACLVLVAGLGAYQSGFAESLERSLKIPESMLYIGLVAGVLLMSCNQMQAILMGGHQYDLVNALNVSKAAIPLVLVALIIVWQANVICIVIAHSAGLALVLALSWFISRNALAKQGAESRRGPGGHDVRSMLSYGGLVYLSNLLHYLAMRGLLLLLSYFLETESVGFFSLALVLLEVTLLLPSAIGQLVFPQSSMPEFNHRVLETVLRVNLYVSLLLVVFIFLFGQPAIALIMGGSYAPVAQLLIYLTPSVIFLAIPRILSQLLSGQGRPRYALSAAIISLVSGTMLAAWAIPKWGAVGAAWSINLVSAITAALTVFGYCRVHKVQVRHIFRPRRDDWTGMWRLATKAVGR
jgi:O-antigen/teichoic acid export membrane protein